MTNIPSISDYQNSLSYRIKELIKALPEKPKDICKHVGVSELKLSSLLAGEEQLSNHELESIREYFIASYEQSTFWLNGLYTTFPKGAKQIIALHEEVTNGGDVEFSVQLLNRHMHIDGHRRFIITETCFRTYTIMVLENQGKLVDKLIESDSLINFTGSCIANDDLLSFLNGHVERIKRNKSERREYDRIALMSLHLALQQLPYSRV